MSPSAPLDPAFIVEAKDYAARVLVNTIEAVYPLMGEGMRAEYERAVLLFSAAMTDGDTGLARLYARAMTQISMDRLRSFQALLTMAASEAVVILETGRSAQEVEAALKRFNTYAEAAQRLATRGRRSAER